ncbi:MAG: phage holin family protein [Pseudotabrizicola sp.]|uniref:phage holin family protein n=1 Tax=Pseudotabrizicola sp. TaxID=2939647 RepID=UPI00271C5AB1|nr:phage holin family protein [Pseudotabrizicola sp.]MDO9637735.1 phage holin family protein [Pseudotabrizicola sp.]
MSRSGLEGLIVPLMDLLMLGRRAVALRVALAKVELRTRAGSLVTALVLLFLALILGVMVLVLLVQAGLVGLAMLGLPPLQALFTAAITCAALALILVLVARSCLRRATLPLTSLTGSGDTLPTTRP